MGKNTGKEYLFAMKALMKVHSKMIWSMDNAFFKERKETSMKEIGKIQLNKVMVSMYGKMEENIKEHTKMIKEKVRV